jgi:hypothetical protein
MLLLPLPVFEFGSSTHRVEAWLEKGGIDDRQFEHRGDMFEADYRGTLVAAVQGNANLPTAAIARDGVPITPDFDEQVDLLAAVGDRLLVGEVKFILVPTDPHHWTRFYAKLRLAAQQARKKARALSERPDVVARSLGIELERASALKLSTLVVLNSGFGFALEVEGCRVVDAAFLRMYLGGNALATTLLQHSRGGAAEKVTVLYETEQQAADRFDNIMAKPPLLDVFSARTEWNDVPYPRPSGGIFRVRSPQRGDLSAAEQRDQAAMIDALNRQ